MEALDIGGGGGGVANPQGAGGGVNGEGVGAAWGGQGGDGGDAGGAHAQDGKLALATRAINEAARAVKGDLVNVGRDGQGLQDAPGAGIEGDEVAVAARDVQASARAVELEAVRQGGGARPPVVQGAPARGVKDGDLVFVLDVEVESVRGRIEGHDFGDSRDGEGAG